MIRLTEISSEKIWVMTSAPAPDWSLDVLPSSPLSHGHALKARQHISPGQHPGKAVPSLHSGALKGRRPRELLPPLQGGLGLRDGLPRAMPWADLPARCWRAESPNSSPGAEAPGYCRDVPPGQQPTATAVTSQEAPPTTKQVYGQAPERLPAFYVPQAEQLRPLLLAQPIKSGCLVENVGVLKHNLAVGQRECAGGHHPVFEIGTGPHLETRQVI